MSKKHISSKTFTKALLDFIIKQELSDVKYYPDLAPLIQAHFDIKKKGGKGNCTAECINDIIDWENGNQHASLETTLNNKYDIEIRDKPLVAMGKVIRDESY